MTQGQIFKKNIELRAAFCSPQKLCLCFAVNAAILPLGPVGQTENHGELLLHRTNATGIAALQDAVKLLGKRDLLFLHKFTVPDDIHSDIRVHIA